MNKLLVSYVGIFMMFSPLVHATEPGTPMNCTDLLLSSELACTEFSNPGEGGFLRENDVVTDNEGNILQTSAGDINDILEDLGSCGSFSLFDLGLLWHVGEGGVRTPIASVRSRCLDPATSTVEGLRASDVVFDSLNGVLIVSMTSTCNSRGNLCDNYGGGSWIARIEGFKPLAAALRDSLRSNQSLR